ncbi:signal recognition particle-docking protein FtsY [Aureimonas psammosilenae]|uniref:signal recognition particle-docking protein FtsY n=1 Tax=Aureimonas psammosilenae TaxID=2495496 RepID=UPI001260CA51|nr:signal recognition particle-docking protein FtsY [Aureimonas psammosilenae]
MAEGFFRRIFSFGTNRAETRPADEPPRPLEETPAPVEEARPLEAETIASAEAPLPQSGAADPFDAPPASAAENERPVAVEEPAPEPGAAAAEPSPEPLPPEPLPEEGPAVPTTEPEPEPEVASEEPAWLDPNAPEPASDFSWLDESKPVDEPVAHEPIADAAPEELSEPEEAPYAPPPLTVESALAPQPFVTRDKRDEFSWLDADAPLPPEEEDRQADFSFLDAPAPREAGPRTSTGEAGFRLRDDAAAEAPLPAPVVRQRFIERMRAGLQRSSGQLSASITSLFSKRKLDEETLQDFEDVLIQADLGVETAMRITGRLSQGRFGKEVSGAEVRAILASEVEAVLHPVALPLELDLEKKPHVVLVVGVNGTGKTTTIGKLTAKLTAAGLKVTLCAGDTFRAAAIEQLRIWGERTNSPVIAKAIGADAAGLAFEAYDEAVANGSDILIIDTAGRLQNRTELMDELAKIVRVLNKRDPDAPHTVLQTLDATTGQNALSQVEIFRNVAGVNGLVMTKLDGTARGGILVAIAAKHKLPVYFIGVGEGIDDLEPFRARDFAEAIAGTAPATA